MERGRTHHRIGKGEKRRINNSICSGGGPAIETRNQSYEYCLKAARTTSFGFEYHLTEDTMAAPKNSGRGFSVSRLKRRLNTFKIYFSIHLRSTFLSLSLSCAEGRWGRTPNLFRAKSRESKDVPKRMPDPVRDPVKARNKHNFYRWRKRGAQ